MPFLFQPRLKVLRVGYTLYKTKYLSLNIVFTTHIQGNRTIKTYQTTTVREKTYFAKPAFYNV